MSIETFGIPLAIFPYSNKSLIIQWLTKSSGLISTIYNTKNKKSFQNEFSLFATSKINLLENNKKNLHQILECKMVNSRNNFKKNWRSSQCASYLTYLFHQTIPENTADIEFYDLLNQSLDLALNYGEKLYFLIWFELNFTKQQGHKPKLDSCVFCGSKNTFRFSIRQGGVCCNECIKNKNIYSFPISSDIKNILMFIQDSENIELLENLKLTKKQHIDINLIIGAFMNTTYQLNPRHRNSIIAA